MVSMRTQSKWAPLNETVVPRPWKRAAIWLLFLGPFFFISYGFANWLASQSTAVAYIVFDWEKFIPFIPWTIIPYWIIDILYVASLFICTNKKELDAHAKRLFTAQIIAVTCFILFPLGFSFERPETTGVFGLLFAALSSFDQPYNQAPSLHITLLVILWVLYPRHLPRKLIWPFHVLCMLIGISVLTTYQHHFIDVPTGALLGWLCVWLWPLDHKPVFRFAKLTAERRNWKMAGYYFAAATLLSYMAFFFGGVALWLIWPAVSLLLVALNYMYLGSHGFQKSPNGNLRMAAKWLYFPYLVGAYINSRLWTRKQAKAVMICDGVYLGRFPASGDLKAAKFQAVLDMTAELNKTNANVPWYAIPSLDLLVPSKQSLVQAVEIILKLEKKGNILVSCALGYSRSALAIMAWLLISKRASTVDEAIDMVKKKRPAIVISEQAKQLLAEFV